MLNGRFKTLKNGVTPTGQEPRSNQKQKMNPCSSQWCLTKRAAMSNVGYKTKQGGGRTLQTSLQSNRTQQQTQPHTQQQQQKKEKGNKRKKNIKLKKMARSLDFKGLKSILSRTKCKQRI
jgi:hypothetical protein